MPNVIGMQYERAFSMLSAFNVQVVKRVMISSQEVGVVIKQDPAGGASFSQQVTLTVAAAPATVPDVKGQTYGDAEQVLRSVGLRVVEVPNFDDPRADGLVIGEDPPAGTTNAGEVRLTVVRKPVQTYLSDVQPVADTPYGFLAGPAKANGKQYSHAIGFSASGNGSSDLEYDLSRNYRRLIGDIAFADASSSQAKYKIEIYGDGRSLYSTTLVFGAPRTIKLDVTRVLRLRFALTDESGGNSDGANSQMIFGDIRIQGLQSEVPDSSQSSSS